MWNNQHLFWAKNVSTYNTYTWKNTLKRSVKRSLLNQWKDFSIVKNDLFYREVYRCRLCTLNSQIEFQSHITVVLLPFWRHYCVDSKAYRIDHKSTEHATFGNFLLINPLKLLGSNSTDFEMWWWQDTKEGRGEGDWSHHRRFKIEKFFFDHTRQQRF